MKPPFTSASTLPDQAEVRRPGTRLAAAVLWTVLACWPFRASAQEVCQEAAEPPVPLRSTYRVEGAAVPFTDVRVHRVSNLWLTMTNYGMIEGLIGTATDPCTGRPAPSFEFPGGTGTVNLHGAGLWVGAVKGRDTLVSVGVVGWPTRHFEFFPGPFPDGQIEERTTRQRLQAAEGSRCADIPFHEDARSEHDVIAVYYDTARSARFMENDPHDGRPHIPLGLKVTQRSYAWSLSYARDFILVDYTIQNIGGEHLKDAYVGLHIDHDSRHGSRFEGHDDIAGFLKAVPSPLGEDLFDEIHTVWATDNDGDPREGRFNNLSNTSVVGYRMLRGPAANAHVAFNWWVEDPPFHWGPVRRASTIEFIFSGLGTPFGDRAKYQMMSNGEIDYDQVEAAISHEAEGWLPPHESQAARIADGGNLRYLISTGPYDLPADSTLSMTMAIMAGENFHNEPAHFAAFWNPADPAGFVDGLDFSDFLVNARWADWVFDTPGFDTDGDGYRGPFHLIEGERVYFRGDGVPDFGGPPAPPAPEDLRFEIEPGRVTVRWNGKSSETARDPFSSLQDFEGYRVYMSRTGLPSDFVLLAQRDRIDYTRYLWNATSSRWQTPDPPFTLDSLKTLYDVLTDSLYGRPFHPDDFLIPDTGRALREVRFDSLNPTRLDTLYYYFRPFDANLMANDEGLIAAAGNGMEVNGTIRRLYPAAPPDSVAQRDDGSWYAPYYEYEYALAGLNRSEPVYFAVTVFDFGQPGVGLDPLETSPTVNARAVWPVETAANVKSGRPRPGVYPNPYRLADLYNLTGWEDPRREGLDPERARKVTFTNVPDTCVVSIFSLDGDLVRRLDHRAHPAESDASVVVWNLITRNTQAVKSGIYIWTVESRFGVDTGKLVIIK